MKFVGPLGAFALTLLILSVVAHVSGNALGTRLRNFGDLPVDERDRPLVRSCQTRSRFNTGADAFRERHKLGLLLASIVAIAITAARRRRLVDLVYR